MEEERVKIDAPFDSDHPRSYRIAGVRVGEDVFVREIGYNRVPPGLQQMLTRQVYILHYITAGHGAFCGTPFQAGNAYLVEPGMHEVLEGDRQDPYETCWVMFEGAGVPALLEQIALPRQGRIFSFAGTQACAAILQEALFSMQPQNEWEEACLMQAAFFRLMACHGQMRGEVTGGQSVAQKVAQWIREKYHQPLRIAQIARQYHFSRNHIYTLFRQEYGLSPQAYLLRVRMEWAQRLLATGTFSVHEVASMVGFQDPLYFSRVFRQYVGVPPSTFRHTGPLAPALDGEDP